MDVAKLSLLAIAGLMTVQMMGGEMFRVAVPTVSIETIECPPRGRSEQSESENRPASGERLDGVVKKLHLGNQTLEVGDITLWVETDSVVLIDCKRRSFRELREGAAVTAIYEDRSGRPVVTVVEAEGNPH